MKNDDSLREKLIVKENRGSFSQPLPVWRKVCFAVGGAPYQITNTVINFFINIFLLEVAQIRPLYVSIIVFVGKVWDAITDPVCGYFVNRTDSRLGKLRPWILFSTPFACTAYFFLWYVPDISEEGKLGYYFVMYCLFQGLLSCLHVPYTSLTMYICDDQKERDSVTAYRMLSEAVGVLLAVVVQGQLVNKYRVAGECSAETTISPGQIKDQEWSYMYGAFIVIGIYVICSCTVFFGVKEKQGVIQDGHEPFFRALKLVFTHGPYVKLVVIFLFHSLAIAIVQGNLALFVTHALHQGDQFATMILVLLLSAIVFMPAWHLLLLKFGKKKAYAAGLILFIPVLISQLYVQGSIYVYYPILVVAGACVAVALLLPWSMLPDVLDDFMLNTGTRKDAIFYSFYVFCNKFAAGIGLGFSQIALEIGGYQTGACVQPNSVSLALRILMVPGPVIFILIALIFLWKYPITEHRRLEIRQAIEDLKSDQSPNHNSGKRQKTNQSNRSKEVLASLSYRSIDDSTEF
ncbi:sodium-dependent lysophosphatidylcholine symporter 1-like isoform X1 [Liolophura sinensis]|uniref:sodium-dependent lysophosphatidylcholine symporter 1-like isoform X1 n=1 Tax=Liolophura sinensis TaxID=3198878 RepID=UPI003158FAE4